LQPPREEEGGTSTSVVTLVEPFCIEVGSAVDRRGRESCPADISLILLDDTICLLISSGKDSTAQFVTGMNFLFHLSNVDVAK
jgi:hypothetical protein